MIALNFRCIPKRVKKARDSEKGKGKEQTLLGFPKVKGPADFSRQGILEAVAKHIACEDQISLRARLAEMF